MSDDAGLDRLHEAEQRAGTRLDETWTVDSVLGVGGMATVYACTDREGRRAALKVLHPELAVDPAIRERFLREARIADKVDHPAIVRILGEGTTDRGEAYFVMELLAGKPLSDVLLDRGGKLPIDETLRVFDVVLELLAACHEKQIVHRDIKPANVFLLDSGGVKVLDFGIARMREPGGGMDATRHGTVLGTPQFMAPEQALGLGDLTDARADLWSVGACIYTALSGERVHGARSQNEALVAAATQSASSIATVAPALPVEVVAFVDKALAHDRTQRFPDATTMRAELLALLAAESTGHLTAAAPKKPTGVVARGDEIVEGEPVSGEAVEQVLSALRAVWKQLGNTMACAVQYGWSHRETDRALRVSFEAICDALAAAPDSVRWDVSAMAFEFQGSPIWVPDRAPFDRIPFQLFGDGVRKIQLKPGLTEIEVRDFVAILSKAPAGVSAEDDSVTALWDRRFDHVAYLAIDSFAGEEGEGQQSATFEEARDLVVQDALALSGIDRGWDDMSLEARAMQRNLSAAMKEAAGSAAALALDVQTRGTLSAMISMAVEDSSDRYIDAFVEALAETNAKKDLPLLTDALAEWASDQVTLRQYRAAFEMISTVTAASARKFNQGAVVRIEDLLWRTMFPAECLSRAVTQLLDETKSAASFELAVEQGLSGAIGRLGDDGMFATALDGVARCASDTLRRALHAYVRRWGKGHEQAIGDVLPKADPQVVADLVPALVELATPAAGAALSGGLRNPDPGARLFALKAVWAGVAPALAAPLESLVDDAAGEIRLDALRIIGEFQVREVGPGLALRIQAPAFQGRSLEEQRACFACLDRLNPVRAESIAIDMLSSSRYIPSPALERTRVAAAALLGAKSSPEARDALKKAARGFWWNTPVVRDAAREALAAASAGEERSR